MSTTIRREVTFGGEDEMSSMDFNSAVIIWLLFKLRYTDASLGGEARQPTPVFLPGESHGQRSLAGYGPRGRKELDTMHTPILTCVHYSLCFSEYLEFSQFKKSITLKTILSEGSCHNIHCHDNKFNNRHVPVPDSRLVRF